MKKLTNEYQSKQFRSSVLKLHMLTEKFKQTEKQYKDERSLFQNSIISYLNSNNLNSANFVADSGRYADGNKTFKATQVIKRSIQFDARALSRKLPKAAKREVILKSYRISDYRGLVSYLKQCNVDPNIFKKFIEVERSVDAKLLDKLIDIGEVELKDIEGCYDVVESEPYVKVTVSDYVESEQSE